MKLAWIPLTAFFSLAVQFLITRLTGSRQISSMSVYEYVNSITLGSLAAELATAADDEFLPLTVAVAVYGAVTVFCVWYTNKSRKFRHFLTGKPIVLMEKGHLFRNRMGEARMDVEELCAHLRAQGYFDISRIDSIVMETTGRISVLPKSGDRSMTPADAGIPVKRDPICRNLIVDGKIVDENLTLLSRDRKWLKEQMARQGISGVKDVFLCQTDGNGEPVFFKAEDEGGSDL